MIVHKAVGRPGVNSIRNVLLGATCISRSDRLGWLFGMYFDPLQQKIYHIGYIMQHSTCFGIECYIYWDVLPYSRVSVLKPSPYAQSTQSCNTSSQ